VELLVPSELNELGEVEVELEVMPNEVEVELLVPRELKLLGEVELKLLGEVELKLVLELVSLASVLEELL